MTRQGVVDVATNVYSVLHPLSSISKVIVGVDACCCCCWNEKRVGVHVVVVL